MTTRADVNRLSLLGSRAVDLARAELEAFFYGLNFSDPALAREALLEFMPLLTQSYGDAAATAAAEWYEAARRAEVGGTYSAVLGRTADIAEVQGSTRYAAGGLFADDPAQTLAILSGALQRYVLLAMRDTVGENARRDSARPRFARVPTGAKTCAWCELLASRGFVYHTKETAGIIASDYHDDCDCMIVSSWDKPDIEGYDEDALHQRYLAAREAAGGDGVQAGQVAAQMRRLFPDQYTDGVFPPL